VWFTNSTVTSPGAQPIVKVTNVGSTNGGTQITVTIPSLAGMGDILVKQSATGHSTLSNAFPFDGQGGGMNPNPPTITSVTPSTIENLIPGSVETITITGTDYSPTATVEIDSAPIAGTFTVVSSTQITFQWLPVSSLGQHQLSVTDTTGSAQTPITVVANATPTLQVGSGDSPSVVNGSVPISVGAAPGTFVIVLLSDSNVPSVLPGKISLQMGNVFQQVYQVGLLGTSGNGIATTTFPLSGVSNAFLYWQGLKITLPISSAYPLESTNLQTTFTP